MSHEGKRSFVGLTLNGISMAWLGVASQQITHEASHGLLVLRFGADWHMLWYQATQWSKETIAPCTAPGFLDREKRYAA